MKEHQRNTTIGISLEITYLRPALNFPLTFPISTRDFFLISLVLTQARYCSVVPHSMTTKRFALITGWAESVDSGFHTKANEGKGADRVGLDMPLL